MYGTMKSCPGKKVSRDFCRSLRIYLEHGYTLRDSLCRIHREIGEKQMKEFLRDITADLEDGAGWQETFERYCPENSSLQLLSQANSGTTVVRVCSVLEKQLDKEIELDRRLSSSLVYPVWVLFLTLVFALAYSLGPLGKMSGLAGSPADWLNIIFPILITESLLLWAAGLRFACMPDKPFWIRTVLDRIPFLLHLQQLSSWVRICAQLSVGKTAGVPLQDQLEEMARLLRGLPEAGVLSACADARISGDWNRLPSRIAETGALRNFHELHSMCRSIISGQDSPEIIRNSWNLLSIRLQQNIARACSVLQPLAISLAGISVLLLSSRIISSYHGRILEITGGL
ncbi:type II secretion system F family protein [Salinispira pacifica]|uniref:Type II secretion system protein GspF domain-containing protein n=1 Tax=Salinispira pacifica TaxID=1307761 RepID=V5WCM4_9SPIO|nr:type II secretion system F family protein [Salinispira pacifica]AHC13538.1 hypothetical protein L21SP2_0094 [Salinispira pacifica]